MEAILKYDKSIYEEKISQMELLAAELQQHLTTLEGKRTRKGIRWSNSSTCQIVIAFPVHDNCNYLNFWIFTVITNGEGCKTSLVGQLASPIFRNLLLSPDNSRFSWDEGCLQGYVWRIDPP